MDEFGMQDEQDLDEEETLDDDEEEVEDELEEVGEGAGDSTEEEESDLI